MLPAVITAHNGEEQGPGWKKYLMGETYTVNYLVFLPHKFDKIKIFHLDLFEKMSDEVFGSIYQKKFSSFSTPVDKAECAKIQDM